MMDRDKNAQRKCSKCPSSSLYFARPCLLPVLSAADPNAPHLFAHTVSFEEFQEGSKQDPTIVQALSLYDGLV
jgi:hypothetical protein